MILALGIISQLVKIREGTDIPLFFNSCLERCFSMVEITHNFEQ